MGKTMDLIERIAREDAHPIYFYQLGGFTVQVEDISAFGPDQIFSVSFQGVNLGMVYKNYAENRYEAALDAPDGLTAVGAAFGWEDAVLIVVENAARNLC